MADTKKGLNKLPPLTYSRPKGAANEQAADAEKEAKMREIEEAAVREDINRYASSSESAPVEKRAVKKSVPEEFLPKENRPVLISVRTTTRLNATLDLVCRKEKELNPKRTKAEIINEALAQYVNKRLQAHGYEPVSFDVLTGN